MPLWWDGGTAVQTWPHVVHWDALCYIVTPSLEASTGISSAKFTNLMLLSTHQMGKSVPHQKVSPTRRPSTHETLQWVAGPTLPVGNTWREWRRSVSLVQERLWLTGEGLSNLPLFSSPPLKETRQQQFNSDMTDCVPHPIYHQYTQTHMEGRGACTYTDNWRNVTLGGGTL